MKKNIYDNLWYNTGYHIKGHWRRKDMLDECAEKIEKFLHGFIEIFPCFPPFWWSICGKNSSSVPSCEEIKKIICQCRDPKDVEFIGSWIIFGNSKNKNNNFKKNISIDLEVMGYGGKFNRSSITLPPKNDEMGELISEQSFNKVFDLILRCWNPSSGGIYPSLPDIELDSSLGWMTYYSKEFGQLPKLPEWAIITEKEHGYCIQVMEELPTEKNESVYIKRMKKLDKIISSFEEENWQRVEADRMR